MSQVHCRVKANVSHCKLLKTRLARENIVHIGFFAHCFHGGRRQPMCDPEGCATVWGAVGGGGTPPPSEEMGGGGTPPSLTQTQHLFRQAPSAQTDKANKTQCDRS